MKKSAFLFVLIAATMWGSIGPFVRVLEERGLTSMQILCLCMLFAGALSALVLLIYDRRMLRIAPRDIWCFIGSGIIGEFGLNCCYYVTVTITSLSVAAVFLFTSPIFVIILSRFIFKERLTWKKVAALLCAFSGCVLASGLLTESAPLSWAGILLGLGSGLGYALYNVFSQIAVKRGYHPFTVTAWTFIAGGVFGACIADWPKLSMAISASPSIIWIAIVCAATTYVIPNIFYMYSLRGMETSIASIISSFELIAVALFGFILYGEVPTPSVVAGIALVLAAVVFLALSDAGGGKGSSDFPDQGTDEGSGPEATLTQSR